MQIDWAQIHNPIIDREPQCSVRDPALFYHNGKFYLFHSSVRRIMFQYIFYLELTTSTDLIHWTLPLRIIESNAGYSSPGNILRIKDKWVLCIQTYPIPRFHEYGSKDCRLWLSKSTDLLHWDSPQMITPGGSTVKWTKESRQIDPFLVFYDAYYWCFYKTSGKLGLLKSQDLITWEEASPERPVLSPSDILDHPTVENVCVLQQKDEFIMFFSPCYRKRGIGIARSPDLLHWQFDHYLHFPKFSWADSGPTAPSIIDCRDIIGKWLMAFHGDLKPPHHARIALAWSDDLEHWEMNYN